MISVRVSLMALLSATHSGSYAEMTAILGVRSACSAAAPRSVSGANETSRSGASRRAFRHHRRVADTLLSDLEESFFMKRPLTSKQFRRQHERTLLNDFKLKSPPNAPRIIKIERGIGS